MPRPSAARLTRHCWGSRSTAGQASRLPIISAKPVNKKGGTCLSKMPNVDRLAHNATAPSA